MVLTLFSELVVKMLLTGGPAAGRPANCRRRQVHFPLKRKLAIGVAAVAAVAFGGGAYAATQSSPPSRQAFLNDVAKRLNVSPQQLEDALKGAFDDQLQAAVTAGKLTQAQANAIKQRVQKLGFAPFGLGGIAGLGHPGKFGGPGFPPGPRGFQPGGPGGGPIGPGGPLGFGGRGLNRVSAAAKYLGLTDAQLFKQLASGKSLAQIADSQHKSVSGLKAAMTAAIKSKLDEAVADKRITSAQEQKLLKLLSSNLDAQINRKGSGFGFKRHFGGRLFPSFAPQGGVPPKGAPPQGAPAGPPAPPGTLF